MNILIISQYFWPEDSRINTIALELKKRGHSVTVLTAKPNYPQGVIYPEFQADPGAYSHFGGIEVVRVPILPRGKGYVSLSLNYLSFMMSAMVAGPYLLRGLKFESVIVYQLSPVTVIFPSFLIARIKKADLVPWVQDLWPESIKAAGVNLFPPIVAVLKYATDFVFKRSSRVICQSKAFVDALENRGVPRDRLVYIPNWAEDVYSRTGCEYAPELSLDETRFTIMFAGNIGVAQDLPNILRAIQIVAESNRNVRWVFVGDGRLHGWLETQVQLLELTDIVLLLGRFPVSRMPSFFRHADAMLIALLDAPVFSMTVPAKLQSYFMSRKPVLGMLSGEGARMIEESQAGYVCRSGDYESLAQLALTMAALPPEDLQVFTLNAEKYSVDEFGQDILMIRLGNALDPSLDD
jgi:colanic acid biosynthesis glycosyl transferase WcaI